MSINKKQRNIIFILSCLFVTLSCSLPNTKNQQQQIVYIEVTTEPTQSISLEASSIEVCESFENLEMNVITLEFPTNSNLLTFYLGINGGIPTADDPYVFSANTIGKTANCEMIDGFDDRVYCSLKIPTNQIATSPEVKFYAEGCGGAIYSDNLDIPAMAAVDNTSENSNGNDDTSEPEDNNNTEDDSDDDESGIPIITIPIEDISKFKVSVKAENIDGDYVKHVGGKFILYQNDCGGNIILTTPNIAGTHTFSVLNGLIYCVEYDYEGAACLFNPVTIAKTKFGFNESIHFIFYLIYTC